MKRLFVVVLCVLACVWPAFGQEKDLTGTWQGTLEAGKSLRIVFKISKGAGGALQAKFYSLDQGILGAPVTTVTRDGTAVKMSLGPATYEGKLTADGKEIDGNWVQGKSFPLNLKLATEADAWAIPEPPKEMAANADPGFEVATIKPSNPDTQGKYITIRGGMFKSANFSLADLVAFAYGVNTKQIVGAPSWAETDRYDIEGKPDTPGTPNAEQLRTMVKKLVAERFSLKFHMEKKELSVYALARGKGEPKLTKAEVDAGNLPGLFFTGLGKLNVTNATMENFCHLMQEAVLDRPVVDQTGLAGKWNFTLNWTPDESQFGGMGFKVPPPSDKADAPPPLFTAIQEQLGLKLEATKAPVDVMAIDTVEKPSAN
jgi:uncharacterized protein (TIGR03435 family)